MAKSKYEYVKEFENYQTMLPNTYIVVRVDGKGFHKLTKQYDFEKPNDLKGIQLMNLSADIVMQTFTDIILAYGQSDEYSFLFDKDSQLYNRRSDKIATCVCSTFTAAYTFHFESILGKKLEMPSLPVFDSRCVLYPTIDNVKDYFSWRQVDCHINNLYNTTFWGLVKKGKNKQEVEAILSKTNAGGKNEILFTELGINYNNEPEIFKKGTALVRVISEVVQLGIIVNQESEQQKQNKKDRKKVKQQYENVKENTKVKHLHTDIIKDEFWVTNNIFKNK